MNRQSKAKIAKFSKQAIGQAELAQVIRMIQNRIDYLRTNANDPEDKIDVLEQFQLAACKMKVK